MLYALVAVFEQARKRYHDQPGSFQGDGKMRRQIAAALYLAALGVIALSSASLAIAQQKTAKACAEEWQADKTTNQANGVTERAYVARCRAGSSKAAGDRQVYSIKQVYSSIKDVMESMIDPSAGGHWRRKGGCLRELPSDILVSAGQASLYPQLAARFGHAEPFPRSHGLAPPGRPRFA